MKTNYTVPSLSSLESNGIKDLSSVNSCHFENLRVIRLTGVPVRIRVDKDYVELTSTENEIDLKAYKGVFEKLMGFFYGVGYIFGYVNDGKLSVYDIYTNDNYFSTRDMAIIEKEFGLPIAEPIVEGNLTLEYIIGVLDKKINNEQIPAEELHILPSVYINETRTWAETKPKEISTIILGEKVTYTQKYDYDKKTWVYTPVSSQVGSLLDTISVAEVAKETKPKNNGAVLLPTSKVYKLSTKEERVHIFKETYKNICTYISKNTFTNQEMRWWSANGRFLTYLYSIHTLPSTRSIIYDYAKNYDIEYYASLGTISEKWELLFEDYFVQEFSHSERLMKLTSQYNFSYFFEEFFQEELEAFDKFYVKEADLKFDWRYYKIGGVN